MVLIMKCSLSNDISSVQRYSGALVRLLPLCKALCYKGQNKLSRLWLFLARECVSLCVHVCAPVHVCICAYICIHAYRKIHSN